MPFTQTGQRPGRAREKRQVPDVFGKGYLPPVQPSAALNPQYPGMSMQPPASQPNQTQMTPLMRQVFAQMLGQAQQQ